MTADFAARVAAARSLDELCDLLNSYRPTDEQDQVEDACDLTNLPVFGGDEPADTTGIWSWDEDDLLVSAPRGFRIVPRE